MKTYFIECCEANLPAVSAIADELQKRGATVTFAAGMDYPARIEQIRACDAVLFFVSKQLFREEAVALYQDYNCCKEHSTPIHCITLDNIDSLSYRSIPKNTYAFWSGIRTIQGINLAASASASQKAQAILDAMEAPKRRPIRKSKVKPILAAVAAVAVLTCGAVYLQYAVALHNVKPLDSFSSAQQIMKGAHVTFGNYEQDGNLTNGAEPIEWVVLDKDGNRVLLLSDKLLAYAPYHTEDAAVTWSDCSLRAWLNDDFRSAAFSEEEKSSIVLTRCENPANSQSGTDGGEATADDVFLLSESEAEQYFPNSAQMVAYTTEAIREKGNASANGADYWWLRTPGKDSHHAVDVYDQGGIVREGNSVWLESVAVRPAVWVEVNS